MEAALKQAKIDRQTAKSAFTRAGKAVVHDVDHNRPSVEVREAIDKFKGAYEVLIEKHEDYKKLIEDDAVYENEEKWMNECQETFLRLEVDAKMFIENKDKSSASYVDLIEGQDDASKIHMDHNKGISNMQHPTPSPSEEPPTSGMTNIQLISETLPEINAEKAEGTSDKEINSVQKVDDKQNPAINKETTSDTSQTGACTFKLEKPKLPVFAGNVRDYAIFRSDFKHAIEAKYTKRDAITLLRTCLRDKPLELIKGIGSDYDAVWDPRFV